MKLYRSVFFSAFMLLLVVITTGCSQEELDLKSSSNNYEVDSIYQELMNKPTFSLISTNQPLSRSSCFDCIPEFTSEDLKYLSSLTQEELLSEIENLLAQIDDITQAKLDEIEVDNYNAMISNLDGQEGINKLLNFGSTYINMNGGISDINLIIPEGLNNIQLRYYIAMAVYVDRLARPIYSIMDDCNGNKPVSRQISDCKWDAEMKLLLAGCDMGLDALIDYMTGGAATEPCLDEGIVIAANIERIFYEYEECMGRLH